ncbi:MAG TPA: hypothetical protein VMF69_11540 [Gemmataceae bacterium]|nr:hypothetical protein [Gemmataceae bacterium]
MRRQPPTAVLVIAILHLIGGGLGLFSSICSCGSLLMVGSISSFMPAPPTLPARPGQPPLPNFNDLMKQMNDSIPGYRAFAIVALALSFLLDIMLISGGIGLLKMQPWARWLSLAYAPISILVRIGTAVYQLIWVIPATQALYAKFTATTPMPGFGFIMTISSGIGVFVNLLFIIYPIAVLIVLLLPSTAAAFRGEAPVRNDDWHDEEENDEGGWREPPPRSDKFRP